MFVCLTMTSDLKEFERGRGSQDFFFVLLKMLVLCQTDQNGKPKVFFKLFVYYRRAIWGEGGEA